MKNNIDTIYEQAMNLPDESKVILTERLVEYLENNIDPDLEKIHINTVKKRRTEYRDNKISMIEGKKALKEAWKIIKG